ISLFGICDKLENCINSVIKQTIGMNEIDIILLDQGVDDESKRIIDYYREIYDNIRIISGATTLNEYKNKAIQIANSEYIMFLDQEDYYSISSINRLYEEAICRGINIIGGYNVNYTEKSKSRCWWYTKLELDKVYTTDDTEAISEYINLNNFIFRLDFIKNNHIEFSNNKYHNKCFMYNMIFENKEFCIIDCLVSYIFSEKYSQSMDSISIKDNIIANHEILELLFKNGKEQFICELMANRILYRTFNTFIKWDEDRKLMESVALEIKKLCLLIRQRTLTLGLKPKLSIDVNRVYYDLLAGNIVEAMRKMWYYFKAKQAFQMKVYDVFEEGEYVVIKAIYPFSMLYRNDINFIKNLKVVLYDKESKAESELEFNFGDYTYYKYDYPNEKFLNPLDNLIIKIPLPQFQEGKYSLRFRMLNSLGEFYYSNLGVLRKMGRFKIIENDKIKMLDFKILDKKFEIEIKEIQNTLSEKARSLYGNLLDDIKILKQFPDNPWQLVKLRVSHELGLNKLKKPTVLIGELPNTYQDSGAIFFEYLKSKNVNFNYYYITDKEELLKKDKRCIAFGSNKHRELFITSDVVMNVQNIDDWMNPFFLRNEKYVPKRRKEDKNVFIGMKDVMKKQKRIFMQHGVLYHSGLTNSIFFNADFDALIVSTEFEKSVFPRDAREFIPSILPRYNTYSRENNKQYKKIFFSLTWRNYLKDFRSGGVKEDELLSSLYFNSIIDFVTNVRLSDMMNKYNTEILINIHHTMKEFIVEKLEELNLSKNIKICTGEESINDLIKECDICITDYSSLFFDFIYQNKPVIHYLFDYEDYYTREDNNKRQNDFFKIKDYKGCMHTENVEQLLGTLEEVLSGKKTVDYDIEFFNNDNPCEELLTVINTYIKGGDHENYTYERSVKDIYTT
ncbi:MAG: CDP-glycerol glycerophosphotransferase family protein, partial [Clostridium sp.]